MLNRRVFLGAAASFAVAPSIHAADPPRKKLAVVTTVWNYRSHAWHMAERFLAGYPVGGKWHKPPFDVVAAYVDQKPKEDLSQQRAKEFGFNIYPTIAEALRCGTDKLAVDAVLVIGEHGQYPLSPIGQTRYPRYEFFKQVAAVFEKDGRVAPVFNDKHLSWKWEWAKEMYDTSRRLKIPFLAGSSLPQTWRMPAIDMPDGAEIEEIVGVAMGRVDSYDFHALEMIQCMAERRKSGETGVKSLQALRGDSVWKAMSDKEWNADLFEACLCRSQTLAQGPTTSHRHPASEQMREWVKEPVAYRFEYVDGLKATMLLLNGLVGDFTFAAKIKGQAEPFSTLFYLPPNPNVTYSAGLMAKAEELFTTGKPPYPIERTLLTTGLVEAGMRALAEGQKRLETPHLAIAYQAPRKSEFLKD
ncbi:MAG TPA: hypothetical protein VHR66_26645 [Gemmataceae bacterium]|nr:hypothetical protein [Gemmataceae bacterium]